MLMRVLILITLLTISLWTVTTQGRTYRWVDENGITVYSQTPPPGGKSATRIKPPPPPSTGEEDAWKNVNRMWQRASDLKEERQIKTDKKRKEKETNRVKEKNCAAARQNLNVLQASPRTMVQTPDGEYHRYTEEERRQKIEEAQEQIKEHCP